MDQIQAELDAMHGQNKLSDAVKDVKPVPESLQTGTIERTLPPLPGSVHLTPEEQRAAIGEETAEYETLSEEPEAAARLYNAPLEATYPGSLFCRARRRCCVSMGGCGRILSLTQGLLECRTRLFLRRYRFRRVRAPTITRRAFVRAVFRQTFEFRCAAGELRGCSCSTTFSAAMGRRRHGCAMRTPRLHNILVGQTFTNFRDPDATPDSLRFPGTELAAERASSAGSI